MNKEKITRDKSSDHPFILSCNHLHFEHFDEDLRKEYRQYSKELIIKYNEHFGNTPLKIKMISDNRGEAQAVNILRRFGLMHTIYNNLQLRSYNLWPISQTESEIFLRGKNFSSTDYIEELGLALFDLTPSGANSMEAKEIFKILANSKKLLKLTQDDLESRLIIENLGIEKDHNSYLGFKFQILPGVSNIYTHEILYETGRDIYFSYGLKKGFPLINEINVSKKRILFMPEERMVEDSFSNIGLRIISRYNSFALDIRGKDLRSEQHCILINFVRKKMMFLKVKYMISFK
ncbi:MAG: hypothetical protein ACOYT4_02210 [Nanoarchaeota archaeon]